MIFFRSHEGYTELVQEELTFQDMIEEEPTTANEVGEDLDQQSVRENVVVVDSEIQMEERDSRMCSDCVSIKEFDFKAGPSAPLKEKFKELEVNLRNFQKKGEDLKFVNLEAKPSNAYVLMSIC